MAQARGTERAHLILLGGRLRQLRERLGLVLQDVANLFQTSRNVPSQWEAGRREPSLEHLVRLADFYGVTVDWLLGREGADTESPAVKAAKARLLEYLRLQEASLVRSTPGERLQAAAEFLTAQDPVRFSRDRLACEMLISRPALDQMLGGTAMATGPTIARFAQYAGLPELWFYQPEPHLDDPLTIYREVLQRVLAEAITPEELARRVFRSPGRRRR